MTEKDKTGKQLERRVADAYREMGAWKVEHDIELAGNQIDVYIELETSGHLLHRIAVEAKDWTSPVGIKIVNDFADIVNLLRRERIADEGIIVSTTGFTRPARNAAQTYGIRLLESADLDAMVAQRRAAREKAQVTLLLDGISSFGTLERQYLVGVLAEALDLEQEQIRVLKVEPGSVQVTLELPADAAAKLARMIKSGQFDLTLAFRQTAASKYHITVTDSQGVVIGDHTQVIQHLSIPPAGEEATSITPSPKSRPLAKKQEHLGPLHARVKRAYIRQRVGAIWAHYKIAIGMLAILLVVAGMVKLTMSMSLWPTAPQISVEAFLITKGESPTATVKPGATITTTIEVIVDTRVKVSATYQEEDLWFTWYTCRTGSKPVLQRIGNPQMLYIAPSEPGADCICVVVEKGGVRLDRERIFVDVQE